MRQNSSCGYGWSGNASWFVCQSPPRAPFYNPLPRSSSKQSRESRASRGEQHRFLAFRSECNDRKLEKWTLYKFSFRARNHKSVKNAVENRDFSRLVWRSMFMEKLFDLRKSGNFFENPFSGDSNFQTWKIEKNWITWEWNLLLLNRYNKGGSPYLSSTFRVLSEASLSQVFYLFGNFKRIHHIFSGIWR